MTIKELMRMLEQVSDKTRVIEVQDEEGGIYTIEGVADESDDGVFITVDRG